ncbi:plastocyanin/azurin family copper-binding protein [Rubinisphaera margarita]|uniref:plastocyanin/azurin family copper-binding protein n=1 Tax=Rubinisphaera margarita TaxID=2909586 RepID=UPI001EE84A56|nr:plastocyanin/azurin family copper-binding protein [Rubinisphaera margarita]MCG6154875.1 plastocyanin/azurin family copper-binding protein [Rubinisphaera margarita]
MITLRNLALAFLLLTVPVLAQEHQHDHADHLAAPDIKPPKIFLDKSERIVWYQLDRLDNPRLLLVERGTDDPKYKPVFTAILIRDAMSPQYREEALDALVKLNSSDPVTELLAAFDRLDTESAASRRTATQLANLLLRQKPETLASQSGKFEQLVSAESPLQRAISHAALISIGQQDKAWQLASASPAKAADWLAGVRLIPQVEIRNQVRHQILTLTDKPHSVELRRDALNTLATLNGQPAETFATVAELVAEPQIRDAGISVLLAIPAEHRDPQIARELAERFIKVAENTPPARRTTDPFLRMMQLTDQLLAKLPVDLARTYRQRLREVAVRVVLIHTVEEEMRYDIPYFAVEAGRSVQIVLQNEDLMPHNLVITTPGSLQKVAEEGLAVGPQGVDGGKAYVPKSPDVLHATTMVQPHQKDRLTITAPTESGEYPYVCTFPRHWMRMYGVMIVVPDLDAWLQNPTVPTDPIGSTRSFVQSWKVEDFTSDLPDGLRGRTPEIGHKLFTEATCALCHRLNNQGGAVGPDLTQVYHRWKGNSEAVLREILDPSHRIDDKYAMNVVITADGQVFSGLVVAEDKTSISLLENPEAKEPRKIPRSEIEDIVKSTQSMMPKALLDRFTRDEILEILALLQTTAAQHPPQPSE